MERMKGSLEERLDRIEALDGDAMERARKHWNSIGKPLGSLGTLEEAVIRIAGMRKEERNISLDKKAVVVFCADHGVVAEGVTQTGQEVTRIVAENFTKGVSTVNTMAKMAGVDVFPVDIGMNCGHYPDRQLSPCRIADYKVGEGTKNLALEAAMTEAQCRQAVLSGMDIAEQLKKRGYQILITGEMGIGNTTPAAVLTAVLLEKMAEEVTGRGAGLSNEGLKQKIAVVTRALERLNAAGVTKEEPLRLLAEAGGFEIAAMVGLFLGGAACRIPTVIDGVIAGAAAALAAKMAPTCRDYMLPSHESKEPAGRWLLKALELEPFLTCRMAPGEGVGGTALMPLLEMAIAVYRDMASFEEIGVENYKEFPV